MGVAIPKLSAGSFFPSILERRRRFDRALYAVVMEAWVHGVSTRKVDDLVKSLGPDSGISKSEVSRICAEVGKDLEAFRTRPIDAEFPYVFADATYFEAGPTKLPGTDASPTTSTAISDASTSNTPNHDLLTPGPRAG